jgi:anti-anti-sigma factor
MSQVHFEQIEGMAIAHLKGDLDAANAAAVQRELAEALGPDALNLLIDLSRTRYLDSAGIDMLLRLSDRLDHRRSKLILVIPESSQLNRLLTIVGLPEAITVHPSLDEALAGQGSGGASCS